MHSSKHTKHFIYPRRDAWFLLPGFLGFALWYLVPFGMSLAASVMENSANAHFAGLENYAAVMQSSYFRLGFGNTLRFFAVAVALSLVIGFLLANMIFWHSRRRISWLTLVLLIPIFLPTAAIVPLWKVMMGGSSWLMRTLKPRDADWKYITLLTLYLWKNIGAVNLLFLIGLQGGQPGEILVTLGYSGWGPGQIEQELAQNSWLSVPASPHILFSLPYEERLPSAMQILGIDFVRLAGMAGHA